MATIAIVDDNADSCHLLERLLRQIGHVAVSVLGEDEALRPQRCDQAVEALCRLRPDLLILDLMLGTVSGIDLLRELRSQPDLGGVPVVIFSGVCDLTVQTEVLRLGAADFVVKGTDWRSLLGRIERLLPLD